ncbi:D-alanyl-D-alanine carboxypeptidase [Streptoalloteichus tenebrarius]|uniref:D-alanyl-D-alanine carboxypeptidase n=1 Tax=Streptoalloteichus tenebrarius (strain ATCC 17920 / DSM 40477 / JCM 4838 / CBS 697.72 / NBRC 16177 / NCIMB 11028 / NRRL B-12390 / A12253. 1 / ISP 5477) TaxID=1933 RepID=A0ABT1HTS0_STRSD|nr:serine hydrolase domain-containing protein [Streptoalloteichus tenebrarius]MCP2258892.1 D-alanyl-D-alanine carboxypeptidase [Streptoalloteichus tenebrarius]BFE99423.1 serine hydrolase domain-containing protein [Streptoalloteichus tenebrarius]
MRLGIRRLTAAVLAATLATGVFGATALAAPNTPDASATSNAAESSAEASRGQDRAALRQAMDELTTVGVAGVQVRVRDQQGDWVGTAGVKKLGGHEKVPSNGRFRVGSITKTFVSTVILQLVGEGRVRLDDPVARHLPEFGLDQRITVRMLLQHTSGLFNYTGEINPDGSVEPGIPLTGKEYVENRFHTYRPEELVRVALSKPARFEPGTKWSYSNTNYILAGLLVEKVTGTPYAKQVERRILKPLGLRETSVPGTRFDIPGPHAHGYFSYRENGKLSVHDITRLNPSWGGSAGEMISTTKDLDRFITALLGGRLLSPELLAEMRKMRPADEGQRYGLGLAELDMGPGCGGPFYGHTGGIHGYNSYLFSNADGSKRFEMSLTTGAIDPEDGAALDKLAKSLGKVLNLGLCGKAAAPESAAAVAQLSLQPARF